MRRLFMCLAIVGFVLSGCSRQELSEPETRFFRDFPFAEIVARVNATVLKPGSSDYGLSSSPGLRHRRDFTYFYGIEDREGAKFDEIGFMMKLKVEAERAASAAGVQLDESGLSGNAFHFGYSNEEHEGWVEVVGTRMEGSQYKLWGVIRERTKNAKQ